MENEIIKKEKQLNGEPETAPEAQEVETKEAEAQACEEAAAPETQGEQPEEVAEETQSEQPEEAVEDAQSEQPEEAVEDAQSEQTAENAAPEGEPAVQSVKCPQCGKELSAAQKFCSQCGAVVSAIETTVQSNAAVEEYNKQLAEKKKASKKKKLIAVGAILAAIVVIFGGKAAFEKIRNVVGVSKTEKIVEEYKTDEIDYDTAIEELTELKGSKDLEVASCAADAEKSVEKLKASKSHFDKGELYKEKADYKNAILHYEAVIKDDPDYDSAQNSINEIIPLWKKTLPAEIDALLKDGETEEAQELVKTYLGYSEDEDIANIGKFIEAEEFYADGYLNSAQDIYKKLPAGLKVNGITVKSRLDTLTKYAVFVNMCGKWSVTDYYRQTKEVWSSGRSQWWYVDDDSDSNMYLKVRCIINSNGKVTIKGEVKYAMYTNYSSIKSYLDASYFTSDFEKTVSLPKDNKISFSFSTGDFTKGGYYIKDSQKLEFNGKSFYHSNTMKYQYSISCDEIYSCNETFGTRTEKY